MTTQASIDTPPGYIVGAWDIDPAHTKVSISVDIKAILRKAEAR